MKQYILPDGRVIAGGSFEFNGVAYPSNWLELASPEDLSARGIIVEDVADPEPPVLVPATISDRQFYQRLAVEGLITEQEALDAVMVGIIPPALEQIIAALPEGDRFAARMLLSGATQFERAHPMTSAIAQLMEWDHQQVDDLWAAAAHL